MIIIIIIIDDNDNDKDNQYVFLNIIDTYKYFFNHNISKHSHLLLFT